MSMELNKVLNYSPMAEYNGSISEFNELIESEIIETKKKLSQMKQAKNTKSLEMEKKDIEKRFKKDQNFYEEFDPSKFETKTRIDLLFYEHVFQTLPEVNNIENVLADYYKTIKEIYEMVNIRPENHKMLNTGVLIESQTDQVKRFKKILSEHINNYYYRLLPEQRKTKYLEESKDYSSALVERGLDVDKSIQLGIKSCLMESLIKNISFPKFVQKRVTYLCEDEDYGKVFDQEHLKALWEEFNEKTKKIASIVSFAV